MRKRIRIKGFIMLMVFFIGVLGSTALYLPDNGYSFSSSLSCNANTYGAGSSTDTSDSKSISDMTCTIYNLITGTPGKAAGITLIALGFLRGAGVMGAGGLTSSIIPFVLGVGIANADGLATAAGYDFD